MTLHALTVRGIPAPVLKALRSAAKRSRRSLNAEVLVRLEAGAASGGAPAEQGQAYQQRARSREVVTVGEQDGPPYEVRKAFDEARVSLLESDLKLTPEERVLLADRMLDDALAARPRPNVHTIRAFDSWEDYLAWKRTDFLL
jgi:plasmid stability protein